MSLIAELKRRNVFKVGAAYLALAWIVVQITATLTPAFHLPDSALPLVSWIGVIGFPFVLLFSWVYEMTPEGLKRESEIDRSRSITHVTGRKLDYIIIGLLVAAIAVTVLDHLTPRAAAPGDEANVGAGHARDKTAGADTDAEDRAHGALLPPTAAPTQAAPAPDARSIAVLPFVNISDDKANEYFSDGISEELLNLLAKVPELQVIARTSSFSFKGEKIDIPAVAAKLHVAHVLEGSVRKAGNKVRITAQLIRTDNSTHLWSETYDRSLDDIFAVQDEIAAAVVAQLKIVLLGAVPKSRTTDPKAYALFLQARQMGRQFTAEGFQRSDAMYSQALEIDPHYVEAMRGLAGNYVNEAGFSLRPIAESYRLARETIDQALTIDPDFARGHDLLGWIAMSYDHDFPAAARHWTRALALEPANSDIIGNAGVFVGNLGRVDQAIALCEWGIRLDPLDVIGRVNLASFYLNMGNLDKAIEVAQAALDLSPAYISAYEILGEALLKRGDLDAALAAMQKESGEPNRLLGLAQAEHALGHQAESDAALASLIAKYGDSQALSVALVLAQRGETDRAFEWLDKAAEIHDPNLSLSPVVWQFAELRKDPRWLPFVTKLGLAPEQLAAIEFAVKLPQ